MKLTNLFTFLFLAILLYFGIAMLYYFGPRNRSNFKFFSPGATLATLLILLISVAYELYIAYYASYNDLYGSLGTIIILLIWIYLISYALLIGFELNASIQGAMAQKKLNRLEDLDKRYDSRHVNLWKESIIYSVLDDQKLSIQGLGSFDGSKTISVGIDANVASDLTIGISKTEGALNDSDIFLVDNYLNIRHDLKASDYVVNNVAEGQYPDRFTIEFVTTSELDRIAEESEEFFKVSTELEVLNINSNKNVQNIKVYDMLGRMIIQKAPMQKSFQLSTEGVKEGSILFIEAQLEDGSSVNKKSVKY